MFLLVPAHPGSPGQRAVEWSQQQQQQQLAWVGSYILRLLVSFIYRIRHGCQCILPGYCTPTQCQSDCGAGLFVTEFGHASRLLAASETGRSTWQLVADWPDQTLSQIDWRDSRSGTMFASTVSWQIAMAAVCYAVQYSATHASYCYNDVDSKSRFFGYL